MALLEDIEAAQKEFAAAIKDAEDMKKEVAKFDAEATRASKEFNGSVKQVVTQLAEVQAALEGWETGMDSWIGTLKDANVEFGKSKKRSVDAEKFYKNLEAEKAERDKARKKLGPGAKPSKEDEIADAAFKKAETAWENDPGRAVEGMLQSIASTTKSQEVAYKELISKFKEAMKDYDKMLAMFGDFKHQIQFNKTLFDNDPMQKSGVAAEFEKYFARFK